MFWLLTRFNLIALHIFHLLDYIRSRNLSDPVDKFTDWKRFQRLASELISPKIQTNSEEEADKGARHFTASVASAYRIATSKITLSDINKDIPGLENLLEHKRRLRKLWQITRDPACKTVFNCVSKTNKRMTRRKALEWWETNVGNYEVTPQALWPIAKSLMKRDGPKASTAIHGPLGIKYQPSEKVNVIADYLENQFTSHNLGDENHERQVETTVQALVASVSGTPLGIVRPYDT
jgi:hypothetical protein